MSGSGRPIYVDLIVCPIPSKGRGNCATVRRAIVDTGSELTIIPKSKAQPVGLVPDGSPTPAIRSMSGHTVRSQKLRALVAIAPKGRWRRAKGVPTTIHVTEDSAGSGVAEVLLGQDYLSEANCTVDAARRTVECRPKRRIR